MQPDNRWARYCWPLALVAILLAIAVIVFMPGLPGGGPAVGASASRAFLDPESGRLQAPSAAQLRRLVDETVSGVGDTVTQATEVIHRQGITLVRVPEDRRMHMRVELDAQGRVRTAHGREAGHD